ncbi:MAG: hypothetical protein J6N52_11805 [Clostridia bacterium]|nr:hypothetical protein [Clostridia bacterium]
MRKCLTRLLLTVLVFNSCFLNIADISAADYEIPAEAAVSQAETSKSQEDIDYAQELIVKIEPGDIRYALEKRIDSVQNEIFTTLSITHDNNGFLHGELVENDPLVGNYIKLAGASVNVSTYLEKPISLVGNSFIIEQTIKFDAPSTERYLYMYSDAGQLWSINAKSGGVMGSEWGSYATPNVMPGKWYKIVFEYDGTENGADDEKYHTLSIVDVETDSAVSTRTTAVKLSDATGKDKISRLQYYFDNYGTQDKAAYVGDLTVKENPVSKIARDAVVKAERNNTKDNADAANELVESLEDGELKTALLNRVANVYNFISAEKLVAEAEAKRFLKDYNKACDIVDLLPDGYKKDEYVSRLSQIDVLTPERLAADALEKAEKSLSSSDAENAGALIEALAESDEKQVLMLRYNKLVELIAAVSAVEKAEESMDTTDYQTAVGKVVALAEGDKKTELAGRLNKITQSSVDKAKATRINKDIEKSRALVELMPDGDDKNAMLTQLDAIIVREGLEEAISAVETAENTLEKSDVEVANALVDELNNSSEKQELLNRMKIVSKISEAIVKVENAESKKEMSLAESALLAVNALPDSERKYSLKKRIDAVLAEIVEKANSAVDAVAKAAETLAPEDISAANELVAKLDMGAQKDKLGLDINLINLRVSAINAVKTMEETKTQADVNNAQKLVMQLEDGEEKEELTNRILAAQLFNNSIFYTDYEDLEIGTSTTTNDSYDMTVQYDPVNPENKVSMLKYSNTALGGFGGSYQAQSPMTGNVTVECDMRFEGNISEDRYISFYIRRKCDDWGLQMFQINPVENKGGIYFDYYDSQEKANKTFQRLQTTATFKNDYWYTVRMVFHTDTNMFDLSLIDTASGDVIGSSTNLLRDVDMEGVDYSRGFSEVYYRMSGKSTDKNCNIYIDNFKTYVSGSAIERVISAESTETKEDIEKAQSSIDTLAEGADKKALQNRLNAVNMNVEAKAAMEKARSSRLIDDMNYALTLVEKLPDGYLKEKLSNTAKWTVCFTPVLIEKKNGQETIQVSELTEGTFAVSVFAEASKDNEGNAGTAQLITTLKKIDGSYPQMISLSKSDKCKLVPGNKVELMNEIEVGDISDGIYQLHIMVWDDINGMKPLAAETVVK